MKKGLFIHIPGMGYFVGSDGEGAHFCRLLPPPLFNFIALQFKKKHFSRPHKALIQISNKYIVRFFSLCILVGTGDAFISGGGGWLHWLTK